MCPVAVADIVLAQTGRVMLALTLEDAATASSYSLATIRRAIDRGELAKRYANSKPCVLITELQDWLESLPETPPVTPKKK